MSGYLEGRGSECLGVWVTGGPSGRPGVREFECSGVWVPGGPSGGPGV